MEDVAQKESICKLEKELALSKEQIAKGLTLENVESLKKENANLKEELSAMKNACKRNRDDAQTMMQSSVITKFSHESGAKKMLILDAKTHMLKEMVKYHRNKVDTFHLSKHTGDDELFQKEKESEMYKLLWSEKALNDHLKLVAMLKNENQIDNTNPAMESRQEESDEDISEVFVNYLQSINDLEFKLENERRCTKSLVAKVMQLEDDVQREVAKREKLIQLYVTNE